MVVTGCQENESCSRFYNFLDKLDDSIGYTYKETVAAVKPREDAGSNKLEFGLWIQREVCGLTNAFELEISRNLKENEAEGALAESTHNNQQNQPGLLLYLCYVFRVLINPLVC